MDDGGEDGRSGKEGGEGEGDVAGEKDRGVDVGRFGGAAGSEGGPGIDPSGVDGVAAEAEAEGGGEGRFRHPRVRRGMGGRISADDAHLTLSIRRFPEVHEWLSAR